MTLSPLVLKRIFHASQEQVFDAWTKPELLQQWFSPTGNWQRKTKNKLQMGGNYQHDMIDPDGKIYSHTGQYKEIHRPYKIVFTWNSPIVTNTQVTIEFKALDANTTELTLIHEFFADEEVKNRHQQGWQGCLVNLEQYFNKPILKESFHCEISIDATPSQVYQAITEQAGLSQWWTTTCTAEPQQGTIARFYFDKTYNFMRVEELIDNKKVIWRCVEQNHASVDLTKHNEWVGTRIIFNLKENKKGGTDLQFTHEGLTEDLQCYKVCFKGWTYYIKTSLKDYIEKGIGQPYTKDSSSCD